MSNQLSIRETETEAQISVYNRIPDPMEAVLAMGKMFTQSGMFGCTKLEQGQVLALACLTEQKSPFEIMRTYHIIEGKLEMKAASMLAKFKERGGIWKWNTKIGDCEKASAYVKAPDGQNEGTEEYTIEDAQREGLDDRKNWKKSTPDMLRARLISKVIRAYDPEVNAGVYDSHELTSDTLINAAPRQLSRPAATVQEPVKISPAAAEAADKAHEAGMKAVESLKVIQEADINAITGKPAHPLDDILMDIEDDANRFLIARAYIAEGQTYRDLTGELVVKISSLSDAFINQVKEYAANV